MALTSGCRGKMTSGGAAASCVVNAGKGGEGGLVEMSRVLSEQLREADSQVGSSRSGLGFDISRLK